MYSPPSVMNDGLAELVYCTKIYTRLETIKNAPKVDPKIGGGTQHYLDEMKYFRFKNLKVINANKPNDKGEKALKRLACDGEDLVFRNFAKFETLHNELEIIVDYDKFMKEFKHFNATL